MIQKRLHYIGLFRSPVSWAKVNREFVLALERRGWTVSATPLKGLHHEPDYPLPDPLRRTMDRPRDAALEMAMEYPENLRKLEGTHNVAWVLYESDLPPDWAGAYREHADLYVCPSRFVRRKAIEAGLDEARCPVVPLGVNTDHFHPDVPPAENAPGGFMILTIGPPHKRKGFRELIRAYVRNFAPSEAVTLLIKTYPLSSPDHRYPWEFDLDAFLEEHEGPGTPEIRVNRSSLSEDEMARLMKASDVFVLPSYGEAFGLSLLESMAVGTPVIGVDYGPPARIIEPDSGWLIQGDLRSLRGVAYDSDDTHEFCVPDEKKLGRLLRDIFDHPEKIDERRKPAVRTARNWTWTRSAEAFTAATDRFR